MDKEFIKNRIINIRSSSNISARSLSLQLGMSSEYLNQVENGRMSPSLDFIFNFCEHFGISLKDFFDDQNNFPVKQKEILSKINKLNENQLNALMIFLDTLN